MISFEAHVGHHGDPEPNGVDGDHEVRLYTWAIFQQLLKEAHKPTHSYWLSFELSEKKMITKIVGSYTCVADAAGKNYCLYFITLSFSSNRHLPDSTPE